MPRIAKPLAVSCPKLLFLGSAAESKMVHGYTAARIDLISRRHASPNGSSGSVVHFRTSLRISSTERLGEKYCSVMKRSVASPCARDRVRGAKANAVQQSIGVQQRLRFFQRALERVNDSCRAFADELAVKSFAPLDLGANQFPFAKGSLRDPGSRHRGGPTNERSENASHCSDNCGIHQLPRLTFPVPIANLGQLFAMLADLMFVLNQFVLQGLLGICG